MSKPIEDNAIAKEFLENIANANALTQSAATALINLLGAETPAAATAKVATETAARTAAVAALQALINGLTAILNADDVDLDTAQERIDFIKGLEAEVDGLAITDIIGLVAALAGKANLAGGNTFSGDQIAPKLFLGDPANQYLRIDPDGLYSPGTVAHPFASYYFGFDASKNAVALRTYFNPISPALELQTHNGTTCLRAREGKVSIGHSNNPTRVVDVAGEVGFQANGGEWDGETFSGDQNFTGNVTATNQDATDDKSVATVEMLAANFLNLDIVQYRTHTFGDWTERFVSGGNKNTAYDLWFETGGLAYNTGSQIGGEAAAQVFRSQLSWYNLHGDKTATQKLKFSVNSVTGLKFRIGIYAWNSNTTQAACFVAGNDRAFTGVEFDDSLSPNFRFLNQRYTAIPAYTDTGVSPAVNQKYTVELKQVGSTYQVTIAGVSQVLPVGGIPIGCLAFSVINTDGLSDKTFRALSAAIFAK